MQFKVGDRVEVLKPAQGTGFSQKNNIGRGTVEAINDDVSEVCVRVDTNDLAWWYDIESVRPLTPATTIEKPYPHEYPKPTPTPSITVGTQVRLTGVVTERNPVGEIRIDLGKHFVVWIPETHEALEVIRQPFKRGEVVYLKSNPTNEIPCRILEDEDATTKGQVLLVGEYYPTRTEYVDPTLYERRP